MRDLLHFAKDGSESDDWLQQFVVITYWLQEGAVF